MTRDSLVFLISGTVFGLLVGWLIGSQQSGPAASQPAGGTPPAGQAQAASAPPLDAQRVAELEKIAAAESGNATVRVDLGNLYFNAERFDQAIPWYEAALKITPRDINASTDLGVCYYYTQQDDRALAQFDHSLSIDPKHVKTYFNQGIVRAFGKQDLDGARQSWQRVIDLAPDSEEGRRAKQILDGLTSGHASLPGAGTGQAPGASGKGSK